MQYISISNDSSTVKISLPLPSGGYQHYSIGCKKIGLDKAIDNAIEKRDTEGEKLWGCYWKQLLNNPNLLKNIPRSIEPKLAHEAKGHHEISVYRKTIKVPNKHGGMRRTTIKRSTNKYELIEAYELCLQEILKSLAPYKNLIKFLKKEGHPKFKYFKYF